MACEARQRLAAATIRGGTDWRAGGRQSCLPMADVRRGSVRLLKARSIAKDVLQNRPFRLTQITARRVKGVST